MTKKLIDTNTLIYAYDNSDQKKHEIAKKIIKTLAEQNEAVLSVQNLVEFSRVLSEKAKISVPYDKVRNYVLLMGSVFPIITYNINTIAEALHIASDYRVHFFDSLLIATMGENFISEIVTENEEDFKKIPWLKLTNPFKG